MQQEAVRQVVRRVSQVGLPRAVGANYLGNGLRIKDVGKWGRHSPMCVLRG